MKITADALLLDLDGTLVDSIESIEQSWLRWEVEYGVEPLRAARAHGRTSAAIVAELVASALVDQALARIDELQIESAPLVRPLPGAVELLTSLPADRWAIVTSGSARIAASRLRAVGLPTPPVLVTADDISRGKPDPEPYLVAAARLGVDPARCVAVEDAPSGVVSARAAGMKVVGVVTSHEGNDLEADVVVDGPAALRVSGAGPLVVAVDTGRSERVADDCLSS